MGNLFACLSGELRVVVQALPWGGTHELTVPSRLTVRELKARLARELPALPVARMFVVYQYRVLQDRQVLGAVLRSGSMVILALPCNTR